MPICVRIESGFWRRRIESSRTCIASLHNPRRKVGLNLKLDESCISNPKSETANRTVLDAGSNHLFCISDLRCRIRPISNSHFSSLFLLLHDQLHRAIDGNPDLSFGARYPAVALQRLLLVTEILLKIRLRVYLQSRSRGNRWWRLYKRPPNVAALILMTEISIQPPDPDMNQCQDDDCNEHKPFDRGNVNVFSLVPWLSCWFVGVHIALWGVAFGS